MDGDSDSESRNISSPWRVRLSHHIHSDPYFMKFYSLSLILLVALLVGEGCKSSTTDPGTNTAIVAPKAGSFFVYDSYYIDTLGNKITNDPAIAEEFDTSTVVSSGIAFQGRNNTSNFRTNSGSLLYSTFVNYDASGDISGWSESRVNDPFVLHGGWVTIPMASKGSTSFIYLDSTAKRAGKPDQYGHAIETITYLGDEDVQVGSETLHCEKFSDEYLAEYNLPNGYTDHNINIVWFSAKLGTFVKLTPPTTVVTTDIIHNTERHVEILIAYSLK